MANRIQRLLWCLLILFLSACTDDGKDDQTDDEGATDRWDTEITDGTDDGVPDSEPPHGTDDGTDDSRDTLDTDDVTDTEQDGDTAQTGDTADTDTQSEGDAGRGEHCHDIARNWPAEWTAFEWEVLDEVNARRAAGANCYDGDGVATWFDARDPMIMDDNLWCSARVHSYWMSDNRTMTHNSPGGPIGDTPAERMRTAGYTGRGWAENIAGGQSSAAAVVQAWMNSTSGHCRAIMGTYRLIGIGHADLRSEERRSQYWTQNFGN